MLLPIVEHLRFRQKEPASGIGVDGLNERVMGAWMLALCEIEKKVDPEKSAPNDFRDMEGWLAWAERLAR